MGGSGRGGKVRNRGEKEEAVEGRRGGEKRVVEPRRKGWGWGQEAAAPPPGRNYLREEGKRGMEEDLGDDEEKGGDGVVDIGINPKAALKGRERGS